MLGQESVSGSYLSIQYVVENWIPLIIALMALFVSMLTAKLTRKAFISSSRPYVYATNLENKKQKSMPNGIVFFVSNSPAKIFLHEFWVKIGNDYIDVFRESSVIRFPNDKSTWVVIMDKREFDNSVKKSKEMKLELTRGSYSEYSSLNGGRKYFHEIIQVFDEERMDWKTIKENGN